MRTLLEKLHEASLVPVPEGKGFTDDSPQPPLDAVCILGRGVALNQRSGQGPAFQIAVDGKPRPGWILLESDKPLAMLLCWLHMAMPRILRAKSVVGQYFMPPPRQARYMINKLRAAHGQEPLTEDPPPIRIDASPYNIQPKKAAKGQSKKAAKQPKNE